jgi:peptide/nickel transport system permease protein
MGLDQPVLVRYLAWIGGMLTGDFGRSYTYSVPVIELVAKASWSPCRWR